MSSSYPSSLDNLSTGHVDGVAEVIHAATINDLADATNKIEAELGTTPSGSAATVKDRLGSIYVGREWLAAATGVAATDYATVQNAVDAAPNGSEVLLGSGDYNVTGHTIAIKNKPVNLVGPGGQAQMYFSSTPLIREAATKIYSTSNHPIIHIYEDDYTDVASQGSSIRDLAIEGSVSAGGNQHGVWVNNRGMILMRDVMIAGCGASGLYITDSVGSVFDHVSSHGNKNIGFYLYGGPGGAATGAAASTDTNAGVTTNLFLGCHSLYNLDQGVVCYRQANGNIWTDPIVEGNGTGGDVSVWFSVENANTPKWNKMFGMWLEVTQATSLLADAGAYNNEVWLTRGEGIYTGFGTTDRNLVHDENGISTPMIATGSLPAASASMNGRMVIEDGGAGNRNLIIYAGGQRFRIDGGANV